VKEHLPVRFKVFVKHPSNMVNAGMANRQSDVELWLGLAVSVAEHRERQRERATVRIGG
jgi:hypothetical protein